MLAFEVVAVLAAARATRTPSGAFSPHFFLPGAAFLLLETRSPATFGLLFGTTWTVNALAFAAILLSVFLAIALNARWRPARPPLYAVLGLTLLLAFALPPSALLFEPAWLRYLVAAFVAYAPVFAANLVFTASFRDTTTADMAFAEPYRCDGRWGPRIRRAPGRLPGPAGRRCADPRRRVPRGLTAPPLR